MLMLDVRVPANRNQAAIATLYADRQVLKTGHAAASVARELAAQKGNPFLRHDAPMGQPRLRQLPPVWQYQRTGVLPR
jgi:hypothetical protein